MRKVRISWTPFAVGCLQTIKEYIISEFLSEKIADKFINKLISLVEILEHYPEAGMKEEFLEHLKQNSRYLVEGNYKIIYQYQDESIIITDVFHTKQNPIKIVKRNKRK